MVFNISREVLKNKALVHAFISCNLFILICNFELLYGLPNILKYFLSVYTLFSLFIFYRKSDYLKINSFLLKLLVTWVILFFLYLVVSSVRIEKLYIQEALGDKFYLLPYVVPVFLLRIRHNLSTFKTILRLTYYALPFAIFALIFLILFPDAYEYPNDVFIVHAFSFAAALLLYVSHLLKWKFVTLLCILYHVLFIVMLATIGRRGETFEQLFPLLVFVFLRLRSTSLSTFKKGIFIVLSLSAVIPASFYVYSISSNIRLFQRGFDKEGFEDTRGETVINFLNDFGSRPNDYLIGRGLNGKIRKWLVGDKWLSKYSRSIEIGYFDSLLKGGFLYLIPLMLLFLTSIFLGFFRSKNDLAKGFSFLILYQIINMVSWGILNFSVYFFMLWIAVASCLDKTTRSYRDDQLKIEFNN
jgi:hypothetical protein